MSGGGRHPGPAAYRETHRIEVDRVVVRGVDAAALDKSQLRALVESAVIRAVQRMPLPDGRTVRAAVQLPASLAADGAPAVADAIGEGVARAVGGGRGHG